MLCEGSRGLGGRSEGGGPLAGAHTFSTKVVNGKTRACGSEPRGLAAADLAA